MIFLSSLDFTEAFDVDDFFSFRDAMLLILLDVCLYPECFRILSGALFSLTILDLFDSMTISIQMTPRFVNPLLMCLLKQLISIHS